MTTEEVFRRIIGALEAAGIPYMLTGSFASAHHGAPRATQDIDLVIAPTEDQLRDLVRSLPADEYYADLDTALDALGRESQFNLIDLATGWKVDLIIRKSRAFSREEFDRRFPADLEGLRIFVATAEDVVIAKLEWAKLGRSQRQLDDVAGILGAGTDLDRAYVEYWVKELSLEREWAAARARANSGA